jgi:hypothetical protein
VDGCLLLWWTSFGRGKCDGALWFVFLFLFLFLFVVLVLVSFVFRQKVEDGFLLGSLPFRPS